MLEVGDVPPPSVSFLLSTGEGSHAAQSIIIARSHIVYIIMFLTNLTKHRFLAYPRLSIPILRKIFQAGECRKVKYSVLFLVGFYDPVFLDIGHIGIKVEGVVP